jgi:hypothetical protein
LKSIAAVLIAIMVMPTIGITTASAKKYKDHRYHTKHPQPQPKSPKCDSKEGKAAAANGWMCRK